MFATLASITDVFRSVYLVVSPYGDQYRIVLITAAPSLQILPIVTDTPLDGVHSFVWHHTKLVDTVQVLRDLGFLVSVYSLDALTSWIQPITDSFIKGADPSTNMTEIVQWLPHCTTYVELFGGYNTLLFSRIPAPVEVMNDHVGVVVSFFRQLRDPEAFGKLFLLSRLFPLDLRCCSTDLLCASFLQYEVDAVRSAFTWYRHVRERYFANVPAALPPTPTEKHSSKVLASLQSLDPALIAIHSRLYRVQLEYNISETVLTINDSPDTLFWVSPPDFGPGAVKEEELKVLINRLALVKGHVAVYQLLDRPNRYLQEVLDTGMVKTLGWTCKKFNNSVVYLNH